MGFPGNVLRRVKARIMDRYGEKLVAVMADTSSDAPNRFSAPKRDLYTQLEKEGKVESSAKKDR